MTMFHLLWTSALFLTFIAIVIWAVKPSNKNRFDEASRLPLELESEKKSEEH